MHTIGAHACPKYHKKKKICAKAPGEKRREEINGRLLENRDFFLHSFIPSASSAAKITLEIELICFDRIKCRGTGERESEHTFTRTGMNMLATSRQELSSINSSATEERAAKKRNRIAAMMMMRTSTTKKNNRRTGGKRERNRKVVFFLRRTRF